MKHIKKFIKKKELLILFRFLHNNWLTSQNATAGAKKKKKRKNMKLPINCSKWNKKVTQVQKKKECTYYERKKERKKKLIIIIPHVNLLKRNVMFTFTHAYTRLYVICAFISF